MSPNHSEPAPNNLISRKHFTGVKEISVFLEELEEYFLVNKIAVADELSILKCSLKADSKIWIASVVSHSLGDTPTYEALVNKLKVHFTPVRDKAALRRELHGKSMSLYDKPLAFLLNKLELNKMLDLHLSYAAIMDIITPLFTVLLQGILDMKQVADLGNLFVTLRA